MSPFFETPAHRKGEKNFERARAAELRNDFERAKEFFRDAAKAFDAHFAQQKQAGKDIRPSRLAMAGICYTRLGRHQDALNVFDKALSVKEIPDAYLHAGYASAKLEDRAKALHYWTNYPNWADQRIIATALKEQVSAISNDGDLQTACETVAQAVQRQDRENEKVRLRSPHNRTVPPKRGY